MPTSSSWKEVLTQPKSGHHMVQVYRDQSFLSEAVSYFAGEGLLRGEAVIVIATPEHAESFIESLTRLGFDVEKIIQRHQLCFMDAKATLDTFMKQGMPEWRTFQDVLGSRIREAQLSYPSVRAYGEMVNILWQNGEREAAIRLEDFWNKLAQHQNFSLLCAYFLDPLDVEAYDGSLDCICKSHSHLIPSENYALLEAAVSAAGEKILGESLNKMLRMLSAPARLSTAMPPAQAALLYLNQHMPLTAQSFLSHVRRHYHRHQSGSAAHQPI